MIQNILALSNKSKSISYLVTDIIVICFIYLLPSLSHLTSIPFYLFEPMRLALVFCIISTNKKNSILIALTLPVVSIVLTSHPAIAKGIIITSELLINLIVFYFLVARIRNKFIAMFISILMAKICYYSLKYISINIGIINGDLVSTPILIQLIMIVLLSMVVGIFFIKNRESYTA
jgi:hypothetical protein